MTATATRAPWSEAARRASAAGITVRQLARSGQWIATSTHEGVAYELDVTDNVAHGCACPAGEHGREVCIHRAAFYLHIGALDVPAPTMADCRECSGCGYTYTRSGADRCRTCDGAGIVSVSER